MATRGVTVHGGRTLQAPHTHRVGTGHQLITFAVLVVLATVSLVVGATFNLHRWNVVIGLTIAVVKSGFVVWFFMHMAEQPFRTRLATGVAVLLVVLLVALTTLDVATRHFLPDPTPSPRDGFYQR